jgi:UDP-glucose 4-epimerase
MSKLSNKVVLITGGAGNIGSYILDKVLEQNPKKCIVVDNLFNSDKSYSKLRDSRVKFYPLDISKMDEMEYIFSTHKPDYVFHCASMLIQDSEVLPRKSINTNIMGTFNIVDFSNKCGVKKICYSSSASVYGEPQYLPVDENHPFQYKNFVYGWTKITAEMIFESNCKVDWLGFRYYNVYSDRMREGAFYTQVFPIFYNKIKNGEDINIFGDGSQTMDLIHSEDIARANMMGLESDITEEFFNVGSGSETTVTELAELMMDIMDKKVDIVYKDDDSQKVKNRKSSTNKINQLLNFVPKVKVRDGLAQYIESKNDS